MDNKLIGDLLPKAKKHLQWYINYSTHVVELYLFILNQEKVRDRANMLLGPDHEEIRFRLDELSRDCSILLRLIEIVEDAFDKAPSEHTSRAIQRFADAFAAYQVKMRAIDGKVRLLMKRFACLDQMGIISQSEIE